MNGVQEDYAETGARSRGCSSKGARASFRTAAMAKARFYSLVPERLYLIDNAVAFGRRRQIPLC